MNDGSDNLGEFLAEMHIFQGLSLEETSDIAALFKHYRLEDGERLYSQGDYAENFYILGAGHLRVWQRIEGEEAPIGLLESGDTFGEEELLNNVSRIANIEAIDDVSLYYLDNYDFEWMLENYPSIYQSLVARAESSERARRKHLDWLAEDETVHLISQRHVAHLFFNLLKPTALLLPGGLVLSFIYVAPTLGTQLLASVFSGLLLLAGLLWAGWYLIDWRNDYFVITNQRVVWLEEVIMQSASRSEAPIANIQSVHTRTSQLGRILDYGDVVVRTYTGSMTMQNVTNPARMKAQIEELVLRARRKSHETMLQGIQASIRQSLGYEVDESQLPPEPQMPPPPDAPKRGWNPLRTREVEGDTFTYHKHWFSLLRNTAWSLAFFAGLLIAMVGFWLPASASGSNRPSDSILLVASSLLLAALVVLIYQYVDWRNDLYRIDNESVIDREKKPLGTELAKSAPLKNILSLHHEKRGLMGILFNFGDVNINVGDATLTFRNVANPAQVQQDIYYRMEKLKQEEDLARERDDRDRLTEWIRTYHEIQGAEENPSK